jgi:hypothetical protein
MRIRRRNLLQVGAALVAGAAVTKRGFGQAGDRRALEKNLDTVLQEAVERGDVPGVIGAVADRDGALSASAGSGRAYR